MEDIICLSSGSEDSDLEFVSCYNEGKEDAVPFIKTEWLPVTPVIIDITDNMFIPPRKRWSQKDTCSSLEVIDLNEDDPPDDVHRWLQTPLQSVESRHTNVHVPSASFGKLQESQFQSDTGEDVANSVCFVGESVPSADFNSLGQYNSLTDILQKTENHLLQSTNCNSNLALEQFPCNLEDCISSKDPFRSESDVSKNSTAEALQNTKDSGLSTPAACSMVTVQEEEESRDTLQIWNGSACSPYRPYLCPSEVDDYMFSDASNKSDKDHPFNILQTFDFFSDTHTASVSNALFFENELLDAHVLPEPSYSSIPSTSPPGSPGLESKQSKPNSPTSTEILASDTATHSPALSVLSFSQPSTPNVQETAELIRNGFDETFPDSIRLWETRSNDANENALDNVVMEHSESGSQDIQHICLAQYRKLSQSMGVTVPQMQPDDEAEEHFGPTEPLCQQSLSLVYSTIEENYPEGTLQLLSDFIQPRFYPPLDITNHLLREILLDPQSHEVLTVEAFNLLMKTQRYHPADASTVPWDWELIKSIMQDQDATTRLPTEVLHMLFQYVSQVLEDDFYFKVSTRCLHQSVTKKMLSCGSQTFGHVKDVIRWTLDAAKESVNSSEDLEDPKKEGNYLKIVLCLQRMLTLALEVDNGTSYHSDKLSEELFSCLTRMRAGRKLRLLLLSTLESKLLRCKLLKLLLDEACSQKTYLPISLSLLLHYLKSSTLGSDPSDGEDKLRKWDELLQLLWMMLLSYEDIVTGHLLCPITKRFDRTRSPNWTRDDEVRRSAVKEAVDSFLSRVADDIGQALPVEMQESLCQLQGHINEMPSITS